MDLIWVRGLTPRVSFTFFVLCTSGVHNRLKAPFSPRKERKGHKCGCPSRRAGEELQFDVPISAIGDKLDKRVHVVHPKGVFLSSAHGDHILTLRPDFFNRNDDFYSKYECDLWSIY